MNPLMNSTDLSGKRALITGASSAGLGAHFARVLAASGAHVVVAARRLGPLEALAEELGPNARALAMDVSDAASVSQAVAEAGDIDILVNNAGVTVTEPLLEQGEAAFDHVIGANLRGAYLVSHAVARAMVKRGQGGSIINIASILGLRQGGHLAAYAISKAGVVQMTKQFALELARYDIRVNALAPGYFATDLNREALTAPGGQTMMKRVPMRRFGRLDELDGPLLLLASDASSYMTGAVIPVDGGHLTSGL
jgi:NAD(P)-dependent dehydrogenase (short-subunit alcohol dehydrogenase family)